ncbi:hypothetical protein GGI35DRAFT_478779 [Trichoderma velutinum]
MTSSESSTHIRIVRKGPIAPESQPRGPPDLQHQDIQSSSSTLDNMQSDDQDWQAMPMAELRERTFRAVEAQKKRKMIEYLRAQQGEDPLDLDPAILQDYSNEFASEAKKQRSTVWGKIQLPTPSFRGETWMELQIYITELNSHFELEPGQFEDDKQKIQYASNCLKGDMKPRWTCYYNGDLNRSYSNMTYPEYLEWCESCIKDADTRSLEATAVLDRMQQRDNERFQSFFHRFETTLSEIPVQLPDKFRIAWLIQKCVPEIKKNIINQGFPATWQQLRNKGMTAETIWKQSRGDHRPEPSFGGQQRFRGFRAPQEEASAKLETSELAPANTQDRPKPQKLICYKCGIPGHYSSRCEKPDCTRCGDRRHTTERHDNPFVPPVNPAQGANQEPISLKRA